MEPLNVLVLNCSLKTSASASNTQVLADDVIAKLREHGPVGVNTIRVADHNVPPGVELETGVEGDEWPHIAQAVLECDVLLWATPIWLGHPSSVAQRSLERLDHYLLARDEQGRKPMYGKVAGVVITGNEDGAHLVHSQVAQGLNDLGFTLPPENSAYWTGWSDKAPEATFPDDGRDHSMVVGMVETLARNLYVWGHAIRELARDVPQTSGERDAAEDGDDQLRLAREAAAKVDRPEFAHA